MSGVMLVCCYCQPMTLHCVSVCRKMPTQLASKQATNYVATLRAADVSKPGATTPAGVSYSNIHCNIVTYIALAEGRVTVAGALTCNHSAVQAAVCKG